MNNPSNNQPLNNSQPPTSQTTNSEPRSVLVGPQSKTDLERRQNLLTTFRTNYDKWNEYAMALRGVEGVHYPSDKTFYFDPDAREVGLGEVVRLFQEEEGGEVDNDEKSGVELEGAETVSNEKSEEEATNQSLPPRDKLSDLAQLLFTPGMRYRGHISIPGLKVDESESDDNSNFNQDWHPSASGSTAPSNTPSSSESRPQRQPRPRRRQEPEHDGTYELIILKRSTDALGNPYILARHRAYNDEQCVHIQWKVDTTPQISIEYQDGETVCTGTWNAGQQRLQGNVCQRLQPNDGAFHTRSAVSHVFTLYPCTYAHPLGKHSSKTEHVIVHRKNFWEETYTGNESVELAKLRESIKGDHGDDFERDIVSLHTRAIVRHRNRTYVSLMEALTSLNDFFESLEIGQMELLQLQKLSSIFKDDTKHPFNDDEIMGMLFKIRSVKWLDFLTAASVYSEQTSAEMRRRAVLMDSAHFETVDQRQDVIAKWKEVGMDLAGGHSIWSDCERLGKNILRLACAFDQVGDDSVIYPYTMRHRLMTNYFCFENSYRRAEVRMATCDVTQYEISRVELEKSLNDEQNNSCPICLHALLSGSCGDDDEEEEDIDEEVADDDDDGVVYKLPCSHCFHSRCVKQWLHNHNSCPVCRADLTESPCNGKADESTVDEA